MIVLGPVIVILMFGGLLLGYLILRGQMRSEIAELRKLVEEGQVQRSALVPIPIAPAATPSLPPAPKTTAVAAAPKPEPVKEEITAEILAIIAAAVAQFVGAGARIRSTRMLTVPDGNAWAQQGRVIIQASHNLAMR